MRAIGYILFVISLQIAVVGQPATPQLQATTETYTRYPSLEPVDAISIVLHDPASGTSDGIKEALRRDPNWDCISPDYYTVAVVDKSGKVLKIIPVTRVNPQGTDPRTNQPYTGCSDYANLPASTDHVLPSVDLILPYLVDANTLIQVSMYYEKSKQTLLGKSVATLKFSSGSAFSLTATPQSAPNESLTNGNSRDVGQLSVAIAGNNLLKSGLLKDSFLNNIPVNTYVKSTGLFSTDEKDTKSSFLGLVGIQHGVFSHWYAPVYFEQGVQGNQTASNLSTVTNLGIKTLLPWNWSENAYKNPAVTFRLPPDLNLVNQYTHRINQLVTKKSPLLPSDDYSLNPSLAWQAITFPASCKLLDWLNHYQDKDKGKSCLGTEINLGLWYLPLELTAKKNQRVEGYGDVSALLPLTGLNFASRLFPYLTSGDPTKMQIRIKYADSVNAANNYARSRQWTYGIEVIK